MKVNDTVLAMMKAWPSLYPTRVEALFRVFSYYATHWEKGELVHEYDEELKGRDDHYRSEDEALAKLAAATTDADRGSAARDLLFIRRENAKVKFVLDNAELLAVDTYSKFRGTPTYLHTNHFDDLPADVTEDWLAAAKELAHAIVLHEHVESSPRRAQEYIDRDVKALADLKKMATQFLERFKVVKIPEINREYRLKELNREAAALGMKLIKAPEPKTGKPATGTKDAGTKKRTAKQP